MNEPSPVVVSDAERLARIALNAVGEPGEARLGRLVHQLDGATVWQGLQERRGELGADLAARVRDVRPERILETGLRRGFRFVVPGDAEWPVPLADLDHAPLLHDRGGAPVGLWLRGPRRLDEAVAASVAVVGSRSATTYGAEIAGEIAAVCAESGYGVLSGAAFGIDASAHRGALAVRGLTVAVLACGVDRVYPASNKRLIDYIAETGLVVSEGTLGAAPMRVRFLARNRLIAALSQGTVVVEAAIRSGALNTASWAAGLGRVVMGVPGPVTSAPSQGVHQLIRHRAALLVTGGSEVVEAVAPMGTEAQAEPRTPQRPRDALGTVERQVLDAVPVGRPARAERIARTAGVSETRVEEALAGLVDAGLVRASAEGWQLSAEG